LDRKRHGPDKKMIYFGRWLMNMGLKTGPSFLIVLTIGEANNVGKDGTIT
jgi:hypothetical protein